MNIIKAYNIMTSAIYYESEAYTVGDNKIMGRKVAGNSFLKAYFKYAKDSQFWVYSRDKIVTISALKNYFKEINPTYLTRSIAWMNKFGIVEILMS